MYDPVYLLICTVWNTPCEVCGMPPMYCKTRPLGSLWYAPCVVCRQSINPDPFTNGGGLEAEDFLRIITVNSWAPGGAQGSLKTTLGELVVTEPHCWQRENTFNIVDQSSHIRDHNCFKDFFLLRTLRQIDLISRGAKSSEMHNKVRR